MPADQNFNQVCYLARYPDLANNGWMYLSNDGTWKYGNPRNRQTKNLAQGANTFWHWQNFGMGEGRVCGCDLPGTTYSNEFNAAAYLARYPDVRGTSIMASQYANNPELHYQTIGILQGRHPGFEILSANSPAGMVSPGTTTQAPDTPILSPGDGTVITAPDGTISTDTSTPVIATDNTSDISTWIAANPLLVAGIVAGVLLLMHHKKPKTKRA